MHGEPKRRGLLDPPRWMDGFPSLFTSGLFALAGVMSGLGALLCAILLAAGILHGNAVLPWILFLAVLAPLFLHLHGRTGRYGGIPGGPSSPTFLSVLPDRRRSLLARWLGGMETGHLSRDGDGLLLRTRRERQWPLILVYIAFRFHPEAWLFAVLYGVVVADMIASFALGSREHVERGRIDWAVLCGDSLVLRFAGPPGKEPLVLDLLHLQRGRAAILLAPLAPFEELPAPRRGLEPRPPRPPRPPGTALSPSSAIDAAKAESLDRALEGMKRLDS